MRIAFFSAKPYDHLFFDALNKNHEIIYLESRLNDATALLAQDCEAACCFVNDKLDKQVLTTLAELGIKFIALRCAGFNNVDRVAAKNLNISIARVPEYSPFAVAEHTVALILDLNRNIHRAHNRIRENDYSLNGLLGFDLHGKTLGVIGTGKIGRAFIQIMQGFGCKILANDIHPDELPNVNYVTLDELLGASQIISLHCPLTPDTHHLINEERINKMQTGTMLINTSRGGLIDTQAVINALKTGQLGYLGIDVYEEESELFFEDKSNNIIQDDVFARLTTFPNVSITGHQGFFTREALQKIAEITLSNLDDYANHRLSSAMIIG